MGWSISVSGGRYVCIVCFLSLFHSHFRQMFEVISSIRLYQTSPYNLSLKVSNLKGRQSISLIFHFRKTTSHLFSLTGHSATWRWREREKERDLCFLWLFWGDGVYSELQSCEAVRAEGDRRDDRSVGKFSPTVLTFGFLSNFSCDENVLSFSFQHLNSSHPKSQNIIDLQDTNDRLSRHLAEYSLFLSKFASQEVEIGQLKVRSTPDCGLLWPIFVQKTLADLQAQ